MVSPIPGHTHTLSLRHADSNSFVGGRTGTIDVMEEYTASDPGHPQDVLMADVHGSPINPNQGLSPDMSDVCGCTSLLAELLDGHP